MPLYWGDLHNHCGISYGYGSLQNALVAAQGQLDFCSVTGHATWHDMPARRPGTEFLVDFHRRGFEKLAAHWDEVRATIEAANRSGEFVTLHSYEAHSSKYGDRHILSPSPDLPIVEADSPAEVIAALASQASGPIPAIAVPHHIAYPSGYRGIRWPSYDEGVGPNAISPIVEVYSKHGCGMRDVGPYPYLHTMGPREWRNSADAGLHMGYHFGFVASTDHHAGYPGSYGDGRLAVLADALTREALWEALLARRTYAVTGDKIACEFSVNGEPFGARIVAPGRRRIKLRVSAWDAIDKIVVYKNRRPWRVLCGEDLPTPAAPWRYITRIEMGWGRSPAPFAWEGRLSLRDGQVLAVETAFRGRSILAPSEGKDEDPDANALDNRLLERTDTSVAWRAETVANVSTLHPSTAAIMIEIRGNRATRLDLEVNGRHQKATLGALMAGNQVTFLQDYASEAFVLHRAVPEAHYRLAREWIDTEPEWPEDIYHVEIAQRNGQWAWITPVYVRQKPAPDE